MDQRRLVVIGLAVSSLLAAPASARIGYRIALSNGSTVVAADAPVQHGTILTFHQASTGALTGVPAEQVLSVELDTAPVKPRPLARTTLAATPPGRPLEPGETLVIGATGDGATLPSSGQGVASAQGGSSAGQNGAIPYGGGNPGVYGGTGPNLSTTMGPNGVLTAPSSTDVSRALASTTGANGFPAGAAGAPTTIGPNGTPTLAPGMPGANTTIGANGTPVTAGTAQPVVSPNGTPVLAQPGAAGTTQPVIGPNGTPTLAQPGAPGSAAPQIGPNGTPILAPAGAPGSAAPNIGPNGTPNAPAPGGTSGGSAPSGSSPSR